MPNPNKVLKVFDADYCRSFDPPETALFDPMTAKSRTSYIIKYMDCPIIWTHKLQTETTFSTCEAEYCTCSEALSAMIPIINLINKVNSFGVPISQGKTLQAVLHQHGRSWTVKTTKDCFVLTTCTSVWNFTTSANMWWMATSVFDMSWSFHMKSEWGVNCFHYEKQRLRTESFLFRHQLQWSWS